MGAQAVKSHEASARHEKNVAKGEDQLSMNFYFGNRKELEKGKQTGENIASQVPASVVAQVPEVNAHQMGESNGSKTVSSQLSKQTDAKTLSKFLRRDDVTAAGAEIIWALRVIYHHLSYRCCEDLFTAFSRCLLTVKSPKSLVLGKQKSLVL